MSKKTIGAEEQAHDLTLSKEYGEDVLTKYFLRVSDT